MKKSEQAYPDTRSETSLYDGFYHNNNQVSLHQGRTIDETEVIDQSMACQIINALCYGPPDLEELYDLEEDQELEQDEDF